MNLPFRLRIPIVAILVGALALWLFFRYEAKAGQESGAVIQQAQTALAMGQSFRVRNAALAERAQRALAASRAKDRVIAGFRDSLAHAPTPRDTIRIQTILVDSLTAQRDSLTIAEAFQRARAERAESRVSLLEANLHATMEVASCHVLNIRWLPACPSRNASLLLGLGTGALAVLVLRH